MSVLSRWLTCSALFAAVAFAACAEPDDAAEDCETECDTPPAPTCDGDTLVRYDAEGICIGDDCRYAAVYEGCAGTCDPDADLGDGATGAACVDAE